MSTALLLARGVRGAVVGARSFKTKAMTKQQQQQAAKAAAGTGGRDPYGLFKAAIASGPDVEEAASSTHSEEEWREHRGAYSRAKMLEHHRVGGHFTKMIRARDAALAALPVELQAEARKSDHTLLPIERRIFTETAPIPDFQLKLQRPSD
jgi:hypothetical protein